MDESKLIKKSKRGRTALSLAGVAAIAFTAGCALKGTQVGAQTNAAPPPQEKPVVQTPAISNAATVQSAFADVAKAIEPAVVTITTEAKARVPRGNTPGQPGQPFDPFGGGEDPFEEFFKRFREFGNNYQPNSAQKEEMRDYFYEVQNRGGGGLGSGMIYQADGLIITNAHVVQGADTVAVKLSNGKEYKNAKVLGTDERTDVAVVKIEAENLPVVKLGDSQNVEVGDWAIAVGNPFGLEHTVTVGVISAKAREIDLSLNKRSPGDYFQTDASINPGNSGGPLCDIYGRVIGVNNAIYSRSGGNIGIGFAIPINTARDIADRLVKFGKIRRGYLGVSIRDVEDEKMALGLGLAKDTRGVLVNDVSPDTPASRAGLQPGDVIQKFNGTTVTKSSELQRLVGNAPVNSKATLSILRGDKNVQLEVTLDELKDEEAKPATPSNNNNGNGEGAGEPTSLGMNLLPLTPERAQRNGLGDAKGVIIAGVQPDSAAAAAGLQAGDLIERVGRQPVSTLAEAKAAIADILKGQTGDEQTVVLYVNRKGDRQFVTVTLEK